MTWTHYARHAVAVYPYISKKLFFYLSGFLFGGVLYGLIEILFRGWTHISMVIVGGLCFLGIGAIGRLCRNKPMIIAMFLSTGLILLLELSGGILVNTVLDLNVWDYSRERFNVLGQICPRFALCWFLLSLPALWLTKYYDRVWWGKTANNKMEIRTRI